MTLIDMRTATITEKGQIAIPREIREKEGFKEGTKLAILAFEDRVELRPLKEINEKLFTVIASEKSLGKKWLRKEEDEAWAHLQKGI